MIEAQQNLDRALRQEEKSWYQKSHCKWLREGDRNTSFFHNMVKQRWRHNSIQAIKGANDDWIHDIKGIQDASDNFF